MRKSSNARKSGQNMSMDIARPHESLKHQWNGKHHLHQPHHLNRIHDQRHRHPH